MERSRDYDCAPPEGVRVAFFSLSSSLIFSGTDRDYEEWLAHSNPTGGDSERNGCVLGVKETYRRRKKHSVCRNGRAFTVITNQSSCLCTREDFLW